MQIKLSFYPLSRPGIFYPRTEQNFCYEILRSPKGVKNPEAAWKGTFDIRQYIYQKELKQIINIANKFSLKRKAKYCFKNQCIE